MAMADDAIEVAGLQKIVFDTADNQGLVAFTDFRHHHTDVESPLRAQGTGHKIRAIMELFGGGENKIFCPLRNVLGYHGLVNYQRYGSRCETDIVGQHHQRNLLFRWWSGKAIGPAALVLPRHKCSLA